MISAIIVAAGSGKRMGSSLPKQFIPVHDKSILEHTLLALHNSNFFGEIIIVLSVEYLSEGEKLKENYKNLKICTGGKERFHSVKNALSYLHKESKIVFIHDAVRPFVSTTILKSCLELAKEKGSAIPAVPLKDSIRKLIDECKKDIETSVAKNRSLYRAIQTPQVFNTKKLVSAYQTQFQNSFTDDASVFEAADFPIYLTEGDYTNSKITTPEDLEIAKIRLC